MTDEVKKALEYWRRNEPKGFRHDLVTATLAAAYAAEHPPDENEPITPEWLTSQGWEYHFGEALMVSLTKQVGRLKLFVQYVLGRNVYDVVHENVLAKEVTTRGQLVRLLKELEP